jgi:ribosomal protein S15P/S13E
MNAPPPDDIQNASEGSMRPGQKTVTPEEVASVKQHLDEHAKDAADKADLSNVIFGKGEL